MKIVWTFWKTLIKLFLQIVIPQQNVSYLVENIHHFESITQTFRYKGINGCKLLLKEGNFCCPLKYFSIKGNCNT